MEIKYRSNDKLVIKDDTKELSFLDLANLGYQLEGKPKHYWVLYQCKELIKDRKIEFILCTSYYYPSGNRAELYFGYFLNDMNRRTIKLNEDGTVKEDYIYLFNPRRAIGSQRLETTIPPKIKLEDYLSEDKRYYESYDKSERITNKILDDGIIEDYIYYNNRYCNLLNHYCDNYEILKNIVKRFDDEWYLTDLEISIRKLKSSNKDLTKKLKI